MFVLKCLRSGCGRLQDPGTGTVQKAALHLSAFYLTVFLTPATPQPGILPVTHTYINSTATICSSLKAVHLQAALSDIK